MTSAAAFSHQSAAASLSLSFFAAQNLSYCSAELGFQIITVAYKWTTIIIMWHNWTLVVILSVELKNEYFVVDSYFSDILLSNYYTFFSL